MKRSTLAVFTTIVAFGMVAAGCGSSNGSNPGKASTAPSNQPAAGNNASSAGQGEVNIKVAAPHSFMQGDNSAGIQMVKEFNDKYKGKIHVDVSYMPWDQFNTAIQAGFASGDLPDLFMTPTGVDIRTWAAQGKIMPIDDFVSADWKKQFAEGSFVEGVNVLNGKTYTWPIFGPQLRSILYYNKDVMQKAGLDPNKPPKTWDELRSMAKQVTSKGNGDVYGYIMAGADAANSYSPTVMGLSAGLSPDTNGVYMNIDYKLGKYTYDNPAWVEAAQLLKALKDDGSILPASYTLKEPEAYSLFAGGKAAFAIEPRWALNQIKALNPNIQMGLAPTPQKNGNTPYYAYSLATADGFVVNAKTKHPKEVGTFIQEGLASPSFYKKFVHQPIALSPMPAVNNDQSNWPYPEFSQFVVLHQDEMRIAPEPAVRNPNVAKVYQELGGALSTSNIHPDIGEILQMYIMGKEKDLPNALKQYNDKLNKNLQDAIQKVKDSGVAVSQNDFVFPNWDPSKNYSAADYKALK